MEDYSINFPCSKFSKIEKLIVNLTQLYMGCMWLRTYKCIGTPHSPGSGVLTGCIPKASVYVLSSIGNLYSSVVTTG